MREAIEEVLRRGRGVATRAELLAVLSRGEADDELRRGHVVAPFRGVYCRPWDADVVDVLERAALRSIGSPGALSHLTALRRWGLLEVPTEVHISVPLERSVRTRPGLVVHRVSVTPPMIRLGGLPTVTPSGALVASWPLLPHDQRRAVVLDAARRRLTTPTGLQRSVVKHPRIGDRAELAALVGLLAAGCESELEIWGCLSVFDVQGLRHGVRQRTVRVRGQVYRLDLAYDLERVAVELDGERWHSNPEQRERDRRRDAALASVGWLTLRYSWRRLHTDVAGVRRELLATLAARRR